MKRNVNLSGYIIGTFVLYIAAAMIISPTKSIEGAFNALKLCAETVIPSLFPFIFCGNMFIALGAARILSKYLSVIMYPLFGVSGAGALAFVLGIVSGYPVGASCAVSLYNSGECSKTEAEQLIAFCNNSGPMFIIGAVGTGMFQNPKIGFFLYIIHVFSAILCGMIFRFRGKKQKVNLLPPSRDTADIKNAAPDIGAAIAKSIDTILAVCGFVVIFAVFISVLPECGVKKYIYCILEITGGIKELVKGADYTVLPLVSFFIALSGVSVFAQVTSIIIPAGLSPLSYAAGKVTQAIIAFIITLAAIKITSYPVPAVALNTTWILPSPHILLADALSLISVSVIIITALIAIIKIVRVYCK